MSRLSILIAQTKPPKNGQASKAAYFQIMWGMFPVQAACSLLGALDDPRTFSGEGDSHE